jgi:hypothetical protein
MKERIIPDHRWHRIVISEKTSGPLPNVSCPAAWCLAHFGPQWDLLDVKNGVWFRVWAGSLQDGPYYEYKFKNEEDAVFFKLRWS